MDRKNCKCGTYYRELIKKSGIVIPAMSALAAFAVLFYVRFVGMFRYLSFVSGVGYWLTVAACVIGVVLAVCAVAVRIKDKSLGAADTFLFTCDFLMIYLLLGMIIFDFVSLDTLYYGVALVVLVVLNVLRCKFSEPEATVAPAAGGAPNISFRKYFGTVISTYGFWYMAMAALVVLGGVRLSLIWDFPSLFLSDATYAVGLLIVAAIAFGALAYAFVGRVTRREINTVDAFVMFALFASLVSGLLLIGNFSALKLVLWLAALVVTFVLVLVLAHNTYIPEEVTDDSFFVTQDSRKMAKGPKIYFNEFYKKFNLFALGAIAMFAFAVCNVLTVTDVLTWCADHDYALYSLCGLFLFAILGIFYVGSHLKSAKLGGFDALLAIVDVNLVLLAVSIFANFGDAMILSLIIWIVCIVICLPFSIVRMLSVKGFAKVKKEPEAQTETPDAKCDECDKKDVCDRNGECDSPAEAEEKVEETAQDDAKKN